MLLAELLVSCAALTEGPLSEPSPNRLPGGAPAPGAGRAASRERRSDDGASIGTSARRLGTVDPGSVVGRPGRRRSGLRSGAGRAGRAVERGEAIAEAAHDSP